VNPTANCTRKPLGDVGQIHVRFQKAEKKETKLITPQILTDGEGLKRTISSEKPVACLRETENSSYTV